MVAAQFGAKLEAGADQARRAFGTRFALIIEFSAWGAILGARRGLLVAVTFPVATFRFWAILGAARWRFAALAFPVATWWRAIGRTGELFEKVASAIATALAVGRATFRGLVFIAFAVIALGIAILWARSWRLVAIACAVGAFGRAILGARGGRLVTLAFAVTTFWRAVCWTAR